MGIERLLIVSQSQMEMALWESLSYWLAIISNFLLSIFRFKLSAMLKITHTQKKEIFEIEKQFNEQLFDPSEMINQQLSIHSSYEINILTKLEDNHQNFNVFKNVNLHQLMKVLLVWFFVHLVLNYDFQDYLREFHKSYPIEEQYILRKSYFDSNYSTIQLKNEQSNSYLLSVNAMTDWSQIEVDQYLDIREDLHKPGESFPVAGLRVSTDSSLDWRQRGAVTPVKSQGTCGSCWAFTATATFQSLIIVHTGKTYDLSQEYLTECTPMSNCAGGSVEQAFSKIVQKTPQGLPQQSQFPYKGQYSGTSTPSTPNICQSFSTVTGDLRTDYHRYTNLTNEQLKSLLSESPVGVGMFSYNTFMSYKSGVFVCEPYVPTLNHAVLLVGYDTQGWIIKNSWGVGWGEQGYGRVSYQGNCGIGQAVYQFKATNIKKGAGWLRGWVGVVLILFILQ